MTTVAINLRDAAPDLFDQWAWATIYAAMQKPYFHLEGYMRRYWVKEPEVTGSNSYENAARVHEFLRSDNDRALHCHPWPSTSIVLVHGYIEMLPLSQDQDPMSDPKHYVLMQRRPGDIVHRAARDRHRVILAEGATAWSLFLMGQREKEWFFHDPIRGAVPWREYLGENSGQKNDHYWKGSMA